MLAGAGVGEVVDHRVHRFEGATGIGPEVSTMHLACARCQHRYRCLIRMHDGATQTLCLERINGQRQLTAPLTSRMTRCRRPGAACGRQRAMNARCRCRRWRCAG